MTNLFISYRRDDSGGHAGRLSDRLIARFGADRIFMDVQDIQPGQNFQQAIRIADRGYIIVHGEIVFRGDSVADLKNNDLVKSLYLGV